MDHLTNPRNAIVAAYFTMACAASRAHSDLAAILLTEYGDHGAQISGCVRSHFPERYKDTLRELARSVTEYGDKARAARPPRMHASTVQHIARLVATRDGSGFYGPQPLTHRHESPNA